MPPKEIERVIVNYFGSIAESGAGTKAGEVKPHHVKCTSLLALLRAGSLLPAESRMYRMGDDPPPRAEDAPASWGEEKRKQACSLQNAQPEIKVQGFGV
jgi:hypothetical protein